MLEPFDLVDEAQVTSVLVEASVQDKQRTLRQDLSAARSSPYWKTACRRQLDLVRQEAVGATFALLIDSSASMSRRLDFVQRTAATLADYMTPLRPHDRRAVLDRGLAR